MDQLFSLFAENLGARKGNDALALFLGKHVDSLKYVVPPFVLFDTRNAFVTYFNKTKPQDRNVEFALVVLKDILPFVDMDALIADLKALFGITDLTGVPGVPRRPIAPEQLPSTKWDLKQRIYGRGKDWNRKNIDSLSSLERDYLIGFNERLMEVFTRLSTEKRTMLKTKLSPESLGMRESDFLVFKNDNTRGLPPDYKAKKKLFDAATSYQVKNVNRDLSMRSNIIKLTVTVIQDLLARYIAYKGLETGDIVVMFKGGNVLRLFLDLHINAFNIDIENMIRKRYKDYFKISDNDFQIVYNTKFYDRTSGNYEQGKEVFYEVMNLTGVLINYLAMYLYQFRGEYFDQLRLSNEYFGDFIKNLYKSYKTSFDETRSILGQGVDEALMIGTYNLMPYVLAENPKGEDYVYEFDSSGTLKRNLPVDIAKNTLPILEHLRSMPGANITDIDPDYKGRGNPVLTTKPEKATSKRTDLVVINTKDRQSLAINNASKLFYKFVRIEGYNYSNKIDLDKNRAIYSSYNDTLRFKDSDDRNTYSHFGLNRIKQNYSLILEKNGVYHKLNAPSELIDLSIGHPEDFSKKVESDQLQIVSIDINSDHDEENDFNFVTYNLYGLFHDLMTILFVDNDHPWDDEKYQKRLNRIILLSLIDLFNKMKSELDVDKAIELIQKLTQDIYNGTYEDKKYNHIRQYTLFIFIQKSNKYFLQTSQGARNYKTTVLNELNSLLEILNNVKQSIVNKLKYPVDARTIYKETSLF